MSVINQMLKDLDRRQQDENTNITSSSAVQIATSDKPWFIITVTVIITLSLIIAVYLFFQNGQLKQSLTQKNHPTALIKTHISKPLEQENNEQKKQPVLTNTLKPLINTQALQKEKVTIKQPVMDNKVEQAVTPPVQQITEVPEDTTEVLVKHKVVSQPKPSMSVSRKRVSAEQLAEQKMTKAEELILDNKPAKAEKLFEEVLMLTPNNKAARKQLAALWFGRTSYQSALNLLSQGIALDQNDSEFRLMQARIYLSQGDNKRAYQVLQSFEQSNDVEYLVTLANVAQQLAKYQQAILSYQHLASLQPKEARWWLGLAVAFDSNGQYKLAAPAYQSAVNLDNLSSSAMQFAKRRLQELEE